MAQYETLKIDFSQGGPARAHYDGEFVHVTYDAEYIFTCVKPTIRQVSVVCSIVRGINNKNIRNGRERLCMDTE